MSLYSLICYFLIMYEIQIYNLISSTIPIYYRDILHGKHQLWQKVSGSNS